MDELHKTDLGVPTGSALEQYYYFEASINTTPAVVDKTPYGRLAQVREMLSRGVMPPLANGYSFVIDRRPTGQEDENIPAVEFTGYFSKRQIPIADTDHRQREHDEGHVASYQDMFRVTAFADMVQASAANSLGSIETCRQFTGVIDGFGDAMRNIADFSVSYHLDEPRYLSGVVNAARYRLTGLIELLPDGFDRVRPSNPKESLFDYLWKNLGLDGVESTARSATAYSLGDSSNRFRDFGSFHKGYGKFQGDETLAQLLGEDFSKIVPPLGSITMLRDLDS